MRGHNRLLIVGDVSKDTDMPWLVGQVRQQPVGSIVFSTCFYGLGEVRAVCLDKNLMYHYLPLNQKKYGTNARMRRIQSALGHNPTHIVFLSPFKEHLKVKSMARLHEINYVECYPILQATNPQSLRGGE